MVHRLRALWRYSQDCLLGARGKWSIRWHCGCARGIRDRKRRRRIETGPAMSLFSEIEKTIERGFRRWTEKMFGPAQSDELLMMHRAILEEIESKVQTVSRGRCVFPF